MFTAIAIVLALVFMIPTSGLSILGLGVYLFIKFYTKHSKVESAIAQIASENSGSYCVDIPYGEAIAYAQGTERVVHVQGEMVTFMTSIKGMNYKVTVNCEPLGERAIIGSAIIFTEEDKDRILQPANETTEATTDETNGKKEKEHIENNTEDDQSENKSLNESFPDESYLNENSPNKSYLVAEPDRSSSADYIGAILPTISILYFLSYHYGSGVFIFAQIFSIIAAWKFNNRHPFLFGMINALLALSFFSATYWFIRENSLLEWQLYLTFFLSTVFVATAYSSSKKAKSAIEQEREQKREQKQLAKKQVIHIWK